MTCIDGYPFIALVLLTLLAFFLKSIGHAYDDIQSQNLQFLRQIAERDEYDMKVINYKST